MPDGTVALAQSIHGASANASLDHAGPPARDLEAHATLLARLTTMFGADGGARGYSTEEVLRRFRDLDDAYAPVFRQMLRQVAKKTDGRWIAK